MADPVSFLAAGVGIADVAFRVVKYLKDVNEARKTIDTEISALISEVENLIALHSELEKKFLESVKRVGLADDERMLWSRAEKTLENGRDLVRRLEDSVKEIYGDSRTVTGKWDGLKKQDRKRSKNGTLSELRSQIGTYHGVLQMWLLCISM
jgi:NurA-like 5'-3' nuclease